MAESIECPICYSAIVEHPAPAGIKSTGYTKTSCGHTFHPGCLSTWYNKNTDATCPCCRAEATETEKPKNAVAAANNPQQTRRYIDNRINTDVYSPINMEVFIQYMLTYIESSR